MAAINCAKCGRSLTPEQASAPCPACGSKDRRSSCSDKAVGTESALKEEVRKRLARAHYTYEPSITEIFTICSNPAYEALSSEPIKLLEVNSNTIPSGIMPLGFDPAPASGIPFSSVIIEVTPDELEKIRRQELKLPDGWYLGALVPRDDDPENGNQ